MKKFTKILATAIAALLALGFAGCDKDGNNGANTPPVVYPTFINSAESGGEDENSEKYVVNVLSEGGLKLNGVQVLLKNSSGVELKRGISKNGKIEFATTTTGNYELVVDGDTLPAGYYLPENNSFHTNPQKREEVTIKLPSKLLSPSAKMESYAVGNIMRDFSITDIDGRTHTLSALLQTKKAVVLNFFFTTCGPCRSEFPHLQSAYAGRTAGDVEVLAICTKSMSDTAETVASLKMELGLTFPVCLDELGLCNSNAFNISGYPTTIVIDRYGLIASRESKTRPSTSFWSQLFAKYASPNYQQDISNSDDGNQGGGNSSGELVKCPDDLKMPSSNEMANAAFTGNAKDVTFKTEDDVYSWPWTTGSEGGDSYICSSNKNVNSSYATVHVEVDLKKDQVLSYEYKISSEANADYLYVLMDGAQMNTGYSGGDGNWHSVNLYVSDTDKKVTLSFIYIKDMADLTDGSSGDDVAKIRNIDVSDKSKLDGEAPLDVMRACATGPTANNKYANYVDAVLSPVDHFYHAGSVDGPLIYMTINQLTPWSDLHTGNTIEADDGTKYSSTIFKITEEKYLSTRKYKDETGEDVEELVVKINGKDITQAYTEYVLIMSYMPAPFYLIPVTESLKEWADLLVTDYEKGAQHDKEWLEFCYYYTHYGVEHDDKDKGDKTTCKVDVDYTRGLTRYNAYTAYKKGSAELENSDTYSKFGRNRALINFPLQLAHNGSYYKFKADSAGVYQIRSYTTDCSPTTERTDDNVDAYVVADPKILVYDADGNFMTISDGVLDHDYFKDEIYEGFNTYVSLDEGEEIYLYLCTTSATRSYYDFEIEYKGGTYEKMMVCSTGGGAWTWDTLENGETIYTYIGINVMFDEATNTYCAVKNGKPDPEQPVYIDMIYSSFFMCDISDYYFATLQYMIEDDAFRGLYMGAKLQTRMEQYLGDALDKSKTDETYGLVPATREIVDILNQLIDEKAGGKGDGNGWLAFAVYNAKMGK